MNEDEEAEKWRNLVYVQLTPPGAVAPDPYPHDRFLHVETLFRKWPSARPQSALPATASAQRAIPTLLARRSPTRGAPATALSPEPSSSNQGMESLVSLYRLAMFDDRRAVFCVPQAAGPHAKPVPSLLTKPVAAKWSSSTYEQLEDLTNSQSNGGIYALNPFMPRPVFHVEQVMKRLRVDKNCEGRRFKKVDIATAISAAIKVHPNTGGWSVVVETIKWILDMFHHVGAFHLPPDYNLLQALAITSDPCSACRRLARHYSSENWSRSYNGSYPWP